jgi:hypothetical protein
MVDGSAGQSPSAPVRRADERRARRDGSAHAGEHPLRDRAASDALRGERPPPEFRKQVVEQFEQLDHGGEDWVWQAVAELDLFPK